MNRTPVESKTDEVRINVRSILDAYHTTGLIPIQGEYLIRKGGKWCGCVLVALYLDSINGIMMDNAIEEEQLDLINFAIDMANRRFGVNNTLALLLGFDGYPKGKYFDFAESEYYTIGRWAANQLGLNKLEDAKRD